MNMLASNKIDILFYIFTTNRKATENNRQPSISSLSFLFFKKINSFLNISMYLPYRNFFINESICNIFHISYYSKFKKAGKDE